MLGWLAATVAAFPLFIVLMHLSTALLDAGARIGFSLPHWIRDVLSIGLFGFCLLFTAGIAARRLDRHFDGARSPSAEYYGDP